MRPTLQPYFTVPYILSRPLFLDGVRGSFFPTPNPSQSAISLDISITSKHPIQLYNSFTALKVKGIGPMRTHQHGNQETPLTPVTTHEENGGDGLQVHNRQPTRPGSRDNLYPDIVHRHGSRASVEPHESKYLCLLFSLSVSNPSSRTSAKRREMVSEISCRSHDVCGDSSLPYNWVSGFFCDTQCKIEVSAFWLCWSE